MTERLSNSVEDYLKIIYHLSDGEGMVSTGKIAEELLVSPASVTDMVQRLAAENPPLLDYRKHQGVALTKSGSKAALETIRRHRLLELFLHEVLGFSWDQVHEEAERLEHVISEAFEERIAAVLGDPQRGLHGEPIPSRNLEMPEEECCTLQDLRPDQRGRIQEVNDNDPDLLRYLASQGLFPGVEFDVIDYSPFDDNLRIQLLNGNEDLVLGASITGQIQVAILE
jgi:DtxR family Mn-dependent transcriptional regulator